MLAVNIHHVGDICEVRNYKDIENMLRKARQKGKGKMEFNEAFQDILKVEGIQYTDLPNDRGGPTRYGITISALKEFGVTSPTSDDIKNMMPEYASRIYRALYWDKLKLGQVNSGAIQKVLFDQAINRGPATAVMQIQRIIANMLKYPVAIDGHVGQLTIAAINSCDPKKLLWEFFKSSQLSYCQIVEGDESQTPFLRGWITRTHDLMASAMDKL